MTIPKNLALFGATALTLCAVLTACTDDDGATPSPTPGKTATVQEDPAPGLSKDDVFLAASRSVAPALQAVPDEMLRDLGHSVCDAMDAGATLAEVGVTMIQSGMEATESGAVVGAATRTYCPKHSINS